MTRKSYKAIAESIKEQWSVAMDTFHLTDNQATMDNCNGKMQALKEHAENLSIILGQDNPKFDRIKFLEACFN